MSTPADSNGRGGPWARMVDMAAAAARSSTRRYPRELLASMRELREGAALRVEHPHADASLGGVWLGHSTVLLRIGRSWVLTDPVFSERIGVRVGGRTFGLGRLAPTFDLGTLPPVDLILVSHAHFDHLDRPTLAKLVSPRTRVITAERTGALIPGGFEGVHELRWNDEVRAGDLVIRAMRPAHWGARTAFDRQRGFNSYVIDAPDHRRRVLFSGDTAHTRAFERVGGADLTIFGIGAYDPWEHAHATPEQAWDMHRLAGGERFMPMHHSTFPLSDEPAGEPLRRLIAAAGAAGPTVVGENLGKAWHAA
ncbi:MAG: MBL fold metallo-hydrolase [Planctomycetota bacterium]|nr:MBL fold metallo-hydrolase [Planctomycetota bacterium]